MFPTDTIQLSFSHHGVGLLPRRDRNFRLRNITRPQQNDRSASRGWKTPEPNKNQEKEKALSITRFSFFHVIFFSRLLHLCEAFPVLLSRSQAVLLGVKHRENARLRARAGTQPLCKVKVLRGWYLPSEFTVLKINNNSAIPQNCGINSVEEAGKALEVLLIYKKKKNQKLSTFKAP